MKRIWLWPLVVMMASGFFLFPATPALAIDWPNNYDYLTMSLGGTYLVGADESSDVSLLNMENTAGLAFTPNENYLNLGLGWTNNRWALSQRQGYYNNYYRAGWVASDFQELSIRVLGILPTSGEYSGLTYWLTNRWVINFNFLPIASRTEYTRIAAEIMWDHDIQPLPLIDTADYFSYGSSSWGMQSVLKSAYLIDDMFSVGAKIGYQFLSTFDATVSTSDIFMNQLSWQVSGALRAGKDTAWKFGLTMGNDDELSDFAWMIEDDTDEYRCLPTTLLTSAQAIFNYKDYIQIGLLGFYKFRDTDLEVLGHKTDLNHLNAYGISPIFKSKIPLGYDVRLLLGGRYAWRQDETVSDDLYQKNKQDQSAFAWGAGFSFFDEKMSLLWQMEKLSLVSRISGQATLPADISYLYGFGIEGWLTPFVALRAGIMYHDYKQDIVSPSNVVSFSGGTTIRISNFADLDISVRSSRDAGAKTYYETIDNVNYSSIENIGPNLELFASVKIPLSPQPPIVPNIKTVSVAEPVASPKIPLTAPVTMMIDIYEFIKNAPKASLFNKLNEIAALANQHQNVRVSISAYFQPDWKEFQEDRLNTMKSFLESRGVEKIDVRWESVQDIQSSTRFLITAY